jgi:hypothetical protein
MFKVVIFVLVIFLLVCKNNFEKHFEKKHFSNLKCILSTKKFHYVKQKIVEKETLYITSNCNKSLLG